MHRKYTPSTTEIQSSDLSVIPFQPSKMMRKVPSIDSLAAAGTFAVASLGKCYTLRLNDGRPHVYSGGNNTASWHMGAGIAIADKILWARVFCRDNESVTIERLRSVMFDDESLWGWLTDRQIKLYVIEQMERDDHEQVALTLLRESTPTSVHRWIPNKLTAHIDATVLTGREQFVFDLLSSHPDPMTCRQIRKALRDSKQHSPAAMSQIFRKHPEMLGGPEDVTPIVRDESGLYSLRAQVNT